MSAASVQKKFHLRGPAIGQGRRFCWILGSRTLKSQSLKEIWRACLAVPAIIEHHSVNWRLLCKAPVLLAAGPKNLNTDLVMFPTAHSRSPGVSQKPQPTKQLLLS